ncbi:MAG TPA: hypothetical protein VIM56_14640 [Rhizomicrobium sp.]
MREISLCERFKTGTDALHNHLRLLGLGLFCRSELFLKRLKRGAELTDLVFAIRRRHLNSQIARGQLLHHLSHEPQRRRHRLNQGKSREHAKQARQSKCTNYPHARRFEGGIAVLRFLVAASLIHPQIGIEQVVEYFEVTVAGSLIVFKGRVLSLLTQQRFNAWLDVQIVLPISLNPVRKLAFTRIGHQRPIRLQIRDDRVVIFFDIADLIAAAFVGGLKEIVALFKEVSRCMKLQIAENFDGRKPIVLDIFGMRVHDGEL